MVDLKHVAYCGLYCGLCAQANRIPAQARALAESMRRGGWDHWGDTIDGFRGFWSFLQDLAGSEPRCSCREEHCGYPPCGIRKCAKRKGITVCPFCAEYPCSRIQALARGYPTLLADGQRMLGLGIEAWIEEQEARRKTGFCYVDIRCEPYEVPDE